MLSIFWSFLNKKIKFCVFCQRVYTLRLLFLKQKHKQQNITYNTKNIMGRFFFILSVKHHIISNKLSHNIHSERLTAKKALQHKWLASGRRRVENNKPLDTTKNLKEYYREKKWKVCCCLKSFGTFFNAVVFYGVLPVLPFYYIFTVKCFLSITCVKASFKTIISLMLN